MSVSKTSGSADFKNTSGISKPVEVSLFSTEIGWCGLLGADRTVERLAMGHPSKDEARQATLKFSEEDHPDQALEVAEQDWFPELRQQLQNYFQGAQIDFRGVQLRLPQVTDFQHRVIQALRDVGYGEQITYGELAAKAGAPRAARAVGTVMSSNRIPILIPCHRVIASGGKLGGFSAPRGTSLKQHLLSMESEVSQ